MNQTVVITGTTGSIGKATAVELAKNGCQLILLGRNPEKLSRLQSELKEISGHSSIDTVIADLSEPASIKKGVKEIQGKFSSLHALINIAAIFTPQRKENSMSQEYMFATNHLGPFILTAEMLNLLKAGKPSRIITVSAPSTTHVNFDDLQGNKKFSAGFTGIFGATKMMNILFTYALASRLEGTGVTANVFHPGLVKSGLTAEMPALMNSLIQWLSGNAERPARMLCRLAIDPAFENSNGKFFRYDGKELKSSKYSYDKDIQERLWKLSEELSK